MHMRAPGRRQSWSCYVAVYGRPTGFQKRTRGDLTSFYSLDTERRGPEGSLEQLLAEDKDELGDTSSKPKSGTDQDQLDLVLLETGTQQILEFGR